MARIKCPECGKQFSDSIICCPNCYCMTSDIIDNDEFLKETLKRHPDIIKKGLVKDGKGYLPLDK